jgi:paraquat-inducible protein A
VRTTRLHLLLTLVNFALLIPGVTLPVYGVTISSQVSAALIAQPVDVTLYEQTRTILGTIRELWTSGNHLVSALILLFSIIVPLTKASTLVASFYVAKESVKKGLIKVVDMIGKWSMADVFVVAIFLAYLATRDQVQANTLTAQVFTQQVNVDMETHLTSTLGPGFYYFLSYCLFSIFWTQVLRHAPARARS